MSAFVESEMRIRIRFEIIAEKRGAVLIDNLALRLVGEIDRGKPASDSFDQDRNTDESDRRLIRSPNCTNEIGGEPVVRRARVHWRDVEPLCRARGGQPRSRDPIVQQSSPDRPAVPKR